MWGQDLSLVGGRRRLDALDIESLLQYLDARVLNVGPPCRTAAAVSCLLSCCSRSRIRSLYMFLSCLTRPSPIWVGVRGVIIAALVLKYREAGRFIQEDLKNVLNAAPEFWLTQGR